MASADPGLAPASRPAEDPRSPRKDGSISMMGGADAISVSSMDGEKRVRHSSLPPTAAPDASPVAPDQFDPKYTTSKYEIWSYYV